ncbi:MAG: DUF4397 domain-containing protein [Vicinamibacteria bacterium]
MNRLHSLSRLAASALAVLALVSCGDDDVTGSSGTAQLRVAHLSPDAPAVDVRLNGTVALRGVSYPTVGAYAAVPAGRTRIEVVPAGATSPVVIDATVDLVRDTAYTVAATGLLSAGDLKPLVLTDDRAAGGQAKVRFVHAGPDAPAVDVAVTGGPVLFPNTSFRGSSPYAAVAPGSYNLEVRVAGTSTVALPLPGVRFDAQRNYTVFAIGRLSNGSLAALPAADAP